ALLDVHHSLSGLALRVDGLTSAVIHHLSRHSRRIEKSLGVERGDASVGFWSFGLHIQLETPPTLGASEGHLHSNKLVFARLFKTEQRVAWSIPTIVVYTAGSAIFAGTQGLGLGRNRWSRRSFHPHPECVLPNFTTCRLEF